ncbi:MULTISPECIES: histidinol-phosphate transaminase [Sanguibacteroides]|uniref:Histidinol-phosphate aminotransferase n=1 Tax=Sanguibacteroides justesenii TaxID=1547597 RepID=A0A0C3RJX2_9PORP|nr:MULTISPECIES: histidinol-phosphate transaminase [Sanguibacteroides]KIO46619.1 histidinol phosphate aminotransferase [Sanguibacteroides justesenii]
MFESIIRGCIKELEAYSCARAEFAGEQILFLDANENPFETGVNRYPDPFQQKLKKRLADLKRVSTDQLVLGNGSDELIDLLIRTVCEPGRDRVILFDPGYSMYEVCARINGIEVLKLRLDEAFMPEWDRVESCMDSRSKIIFFCNPNNPVGNVLPVERILEVAKKYSGLVVVDEAYIDFADQKSMIDRLWDYPNVVVLQTLSKAWGMAGLRVGLLAAHPGLTRYLNRVRLPYNVGSLVQTEALRMLENTEFFQRCLDEIKRERERLYDYLKRNALFDRVFPSEANFILVCSKEYECLYLELLKRGIVVRVRRMPPRIENGLRISVGTSRENDFFMDVLSELEDRYLKQGYL